EERRVFVAVAAATRGDELVVDAVEIHFHAPPEQDVEVFERNARHVGARQRYQRVQRRFEPSLPADPGEIALSAEQVRSSFRWDPRRTRSGPVRSRVAGLSPPAEP